jgi:hypothetical protein
MYLIRKWSSNSALLKPATPFTIGDFFAIGMANSSNWLVGKSQCKYLFVCKICGK